MNRYWSAILGVGVLAVSGVRAQSSAPSPKFEVTSVKRNTACSARRGGSAPLDSGRITMECITLQSAVLSAYGVYANGATINPRLPEITGAPAWAASDTYDITAKAEGDAPFPRMAGPMLRALLEDRFQLKVHRETKEVPVYFLTVAKNGPRLEETREGSCIPIDQEHPQLPSPTPGQPAPRYCGRVMVQNNGPVIRMTSHGAGMDLLASVMLNRMLGRLVIDKTGLTGRYEIQMEFAPEGTAETDAPTIFDALHKLGLTLEPGKGPAETLVIDHVERPTEN